MTSIIYKHSANKVWMSSKGVAVLTENKVTRYHHVTSGRRISRPFVGQSPMWRVTRCLLTLTATNATIFMPKTYYYFFLQIMDSLRGTNWLFYVNNLLKVSNRHYIMHIILSMRVLMLLTIPDPQVESTMSTHEDIFRLQTNATVRQIPQKWSGFSI